MARPRRQAIQKLADPLAEAYRSSWEQVQAELRSLANDPRQARRRARLREIQRSIVASMDELDGVARTWVRQELPKIYVSGAVDGMAELGEDFIWSQEHREAVQRVATKTYQDLLQATKHVKADTKRLIRKVGQDAALKATLQGGTAKQAGREMARILGQNGVSAVIYKNGARHGLAEYAEMAVRTVTATTYNEGTLNATASAGTKYWEVFDGPFCGWASHDDRQALGMIVTRDEAAGHPISHPNCRRAFGPRPDITDQTLKDAKSTVTPDQTAAQIAADRARQKQITRPSPAGPKPAVAKPTVPSVPTEPLRDTEAFESLAPKDQMTGAQRQSVDFYSGAGFGRINSSLRGGSVPDDLAPHVAELDDLLDQSRIPHPIEVWRGITDPDRMFEGDTLIDDAFTSTSAERRVADKFASHAAFYGKEGAVMRIRVPAGSRASRAPSYEGEQEILLARGGRYRVSGETVEDGVRVIDVVLEESS